MNPRRRFRPVSLRRRVAVGATVAVLVLVAACGGDDGEGSDPPAGTEESEGVDATDTTDDGAAAPEVPAGAGMTDAPAPPIGSELAEASGGAPAAAGAALDEAPGPADRTALEGVSEVAASVTDADGTVTGCCLLVAATAEQRQRGLMEVTDLGGYQGMVFVWTLDTEGAFWMRNTPDSCRPWSTRTASSCRPRHGACRPPRTTARVPAGGLRTGRARGVRGRSGRPGGGPGSRLARGGPCAGAGRGLSRKCHTPAASSGM